jgi:acyl dehydratase
MLYFEDLVEGAVYWGNECLVDKVEMLEYAHKNDPLPMHIDEEAAKQSPYGGLIASGGFTITLWFRSGIPILGGLSLLAGFDWHINLPRPAHAGDRLRLKVTIVSKRLSSKPGRGLVTTRQEMLNQDDEAVFVCDGTWMVATRPQ